MARKSSTGGAQPARVVSPPPLAALSHRVELLVAGVAGAIGVLGFAPFHAWPLLLLSLAALFALWLHCTPWRAARIGLVFGLTFFLGGVHWLFVSLHDFGGMPAWMAAAGVLLFCVYLSLYSAAAGALFAVLRRRKALPAAFVLLGVAPALLVAAESLRAWALSGFPWLIAGYSQAPGGLLPAPLAGYASLIGVHGISLLLGVTAGALVWLTPALSGAAVAAKTKRVTLALLAIGWAGGAGLQWVEWTSPDGSPVRVALVQGNVPQQLKWREEERAPTLAMYTELVGSTDAKLTVLPETALPMFLHDVPVETLQSFQQAAVRNRGDVLFGVSIIQAIRPDARRGDGRDLRDIEFYNSAMSIGSSPSARYDKSHLVAFGEYAPPLFGWIFRWLSIPMSDFARGAEVQPPMSIAGTKVGVNICYEDTFGAEIARPSADARLLVNLSNLAWFGRTIAADQHAQFSQLRALETGRWMLRATNTGLTAAINERGEIVRALPQYTRGVLTIDAQPRVGTTPYMRWFDWPVTIAVAALLLAVIGYRRRAHAH